MPKKLNRPIKSRRSTKRRQPGFASFMPRTFAVPTSMVITMHQALNLASGISGLNGNLSLVNWNNFNDTTPILSLYKYFEIVGCRIRLSLATTTAALDSFNSLVVAYYPINYITEGFVTAVPTGTSQVTELPGSIFAQAGAKNFGSWFNPNIKQQFSTSDAFSGSLNRVAGSLIWYADDIGISETVGRIDLEVNCRFYQREYAVGNALLVKSDPMLNLKNPEENNSHDLIS